jgi:6-phosphofructokinase 2
MIATLTLSPTIDESASVPRVLPERKLRLTEATREPGGGGINVARAAHALGEPVLAVWTCGGCTGALLEELLARDGVSSRAVATRDATRTSLIVLETTSGLQYRFGAPGPTLDDQELEAIVDAVASIRPAPRFLVVSGSLPESVDPGFLMRVVAAVPADTRAVVDTSGEPLRLVRGRRVFLVKPNLRELSSIAGRPLESDPDVAGAAMDVVRSGGAEVVLVSLGAGGALLAWGGGSVRILAPTVAVRSTVGAGDSMVAGMVVALSRGLALQDAARYAVAAGSAAVMMPRTQLCRRDDVERLYHDVEAAPLHPAVE